MTSIGDFIWLPPQMQARDVLKAYVDNRGNSLEELGPFAPLTLLVGANNTGKSRLLRFLFKQLRLPVLDRDNLQHFKNAMVACDRLESQAVTISEWASRRHDEAKPIIQFKQLREQLQAFGDGDSLSAEPVQIQNIQRVIQAAAARHQDDICSLLQSLQCALTSNISLPEYEAIYVPALRTAARFQPDAEWTDRDVLKDAVVDRYFRDGSLRDDRTIMSGMSLYTDLLHLVTGRRQDRDLVKAFEDFLKEQFFQGAPVSIVPRCSSQRDERCLHLMVGDIDRPLHDLGDGLGSIIILLAPFFTAPPGTWVFIEEPELFLHPGFQRILIDTILCDPRIVDRRIRAVMATHSNHLAGVATHHPSKVSLLRLATMEGGKISVTAVRAESLQLLDDLGVHNASVLLAGCSIWVEGPSDRDYVRAGLLAYRQSQGNAPRWLEDLHFAIFEYGGSNIVHYDFDRADDGDDKQRRTIRQRWLANRVFLLADRDDSASKEARFAAWEMEASKSDGGLAVRRTRGREIENDLSPAVLRRALPIAFPKLAADVTPFTAIGMDAYQNERMGAYLNALLSKENGGGFADEYGSLKSKQKTQLAATVLDQVERGRLKWDDLEAPFQALVTDIWDFISKSNALRP